MADILHLLSRPDDAFAADIIARQRAAGREVEIIELTVAEPDYRQIVHSIFQADSIQTW